MVNFRASYLPFRSLEPFRSRCCAGTPARRCGAKFGYLSSRLNRSCVRCCQWVKFIDQLERKLQVPPARASLIVCEMIPFAH